jgi:hypothetical protein
MQHDSVFDSTDNQALLAVCARKTIRTAARAGIIWGGINLLIGFFAVQVNPLNGGIIILGLLMLGAGVTALRKPSVRSLFTEALVSVLLLCWNLGITMMNARAGETGHVGAHGLIFPAIAAVMFFRQYRRLGHLNDAIATLDHAMVIEASSLCRALFKSKLKQSPDVAETSSKRFRVRLMSDSAFCAQKDFTRAFRMDRASLLGSIPDQSRARLQLVVNHPLGKMTCKFDKKNSLKIRGWLAAAAQPTA